MIYWFILAAFIILLIYIYIQNNFFSTTTYKIFIPKLHPKLKGKKILFFSDTHFRSSNSPSFYNQLTKKIDKLNPDLILFGGDIIQANAKEGAAEHAKGFFFKMGKIARTYLIYGNHDRQNRQSNAIQSQLKIAGVNLLSNEAKWISFGDRRAGFWLMGLNEFQASLDAKGDPLSSIKLPKGSENEPKILLAHYPQYFEKYLNNEKTRPDLVLSGHTHGGQVILPIIGGLFAPGQGFNPFYDFGLFKSEKYPSSRLILTRGIGNSTFPIRINNRPELVMIELG